MGSLTGIILTLLVISVTLATAARNRPDKHTKMGSPSTRVKAGNIHLDYPEGSGDMFENPGDDDDSSGGGAAIMSQCHRQQMDAREMNAPNVYIPQCMKNGEYDNKQCHTARNLCWCVDTSGIEIPNTRRRDSEKMTCPRVPAPDYKPIQRVTTRIPKIHQHVTRPSATFTTQNELILVESKNSKFNNGAESVEIAFASPDGNDLDDKGGAPEIRHSQNSVFSKPGFLAVIIGGAVVGLLFSVTLVMFIVYRMRKKDEGSYALDEPKASPTVGYTKTRDREFFA